MAATHDPIDVRACASAVTAALTDLQGYMTAAVNPDRIALADLEMEPMGWTKRVYSTKAFETWQAQLRLFPDDPLILHHMAIMHHARAFDLESGPEPGASDGDWRAAMACWHRLHAMDAFWDRLTEKACAGTVRQDVVSKLRAAVPQKIMAIHYDIALDPETREKRKARAKFHVAMVHQAPFDADERAAAQRAAYNQYIQAVPDEVWQPNELREDVLDKGQKAIVEYLKFDAGCIHALEDALRLQRRIQRSRNTLWRSLDAKDPQRMAILSLEKKDAEGWRPFFDQLVAVADQLDEDVREDLGRWYHGRGGDLSAMEEYGKAIELYERAVGASRSGSDGRKEHVRELVQTMAVLAREKMARKDSGARAYCEKVRTRDDLSIIACCILAQAYLQAPEFDAAAALCERGLGIEPEFDDLEADSWLQRLAELKREIPIHERLKTARAAIEAGKPQDAVPPLNEAATLAEAAGVVRDFTSIFWLRAQAQLAVGRIAEGRQDAERFIRHVGNDASPSDLEAGRRLMEIVAEKERVHSIRPLLDRAKKAMEAGRFQDALAPLDEAARKAPRMDVVFFLRAQALCAVGRIADAQRDAKTVADLAETDQDRKQATELKEIIAKAQAASVINGWLNAARTAMEAGRFKDALKPLNEAATKAPRNDVVFFLRAQAHLAIGSVDAARRDAQTVAKLAETADDVAAAEKLTRLIDQRAATAAVQGHLAKAKSAMESRSFSQALTALDAAASLAPTEAVIYFMRAQARMASGNVTGAMHDATTFETLAESREEKDAATRLKKALFGELGR